MAEQAIPREVAQQAVEWLVELQAPNPTDGVYEQWRQWRRADPLHEKAWQRIEAVNGRLGALGGPDTLDLAQAALAPRGSVRRRHMVTSLAIVLFAGGAAWTGYRQTAWREVLADERTSFGERRTLDLEDGTRVVLNSDTALDVCFDAEQRCLRLIAGEILVQSGKHGGGRPLRVETPQGRATALGTRFSVRLDGGGTSRIGVYEGAVRLEPMEGEQSLVLKVGQMSHFDKRSVAAPQATSEDSATAWVDGILTVRNMRLDEFLSELARYSAHPLSCDGSVAHLRISGSYPLSDIGQVLDNIAGLLGLEVQTVTRFWGYRVVRVSLAQASGKNNSAV